MNKDQEMKEIDIEIEKSSSERGAPELTFFFFPLPSFVSIRCPFTALQQELCAGHFYDSRYNRNLLYCPGLSI